MVSLVVSPHAMLGPIDPFKYLLPHIPHTQTHAHVHAHRHAHSTSQWFLESQRSLRWCGSHLCYVVIARTASTRIPSLPKWDYRMPYSYYTVLKTQQSQVPMSQWDFWWMPLCSAQNLMKSICGPTKGVPHRTVVMLPSTPKPDLVYWTRRVSSDSLIT